MPFNTTLIQPPTDAQVTVTFAGLLLLRPGNGNTLEVGIHRYSRTHLFQAILVVNKPSRPPRVIRLFTGPLTGNFEIMVDPAPATGIEVFTPTALFNRTDPNNNPLDYRWSLNMRSWAGHEQVDFEDGAKPIATLNTGVIYTPNLTGRTYTPVLVAGDGSEQPLNRLAADLAAAIVLPEGAKLKLKWDEMGHSETQDLPREIDPPGTTYTVALINDPPARGAADHDELALYYRALKRAGGEVPPAIRLRLEMRNLPKTDEIPCLPIVLES